MKKTLIITLLGIIGLLATSCTDDSENVLPDLNTSDTGTATAGTGAREVDDRD